MLALHASQLFFFLKIGAKVDRDFRVSIEKRKGMLALEGGIGKIRSATIGKPQQARQSLLRLAYKTKGLACVCGACSLPTFSGGACNSVRSKEATPELFPHGAPNTPPCFAD